MTEFNPDQFLLDIEETDLPEEAKVKCKRLRENIKYAAPEMLGLRFFNGYSSTPGICGIFGQYASGDDDLSRDIAKKYAEIVKSYEAWQQERDKQESSNK